MSDRIPLFGLGILVAVAFASAVAVTSCALQGRRTGAKPAPSPRTPAAHALACARLHPDPHVRDTFVREVRQGVIVLEVVDLQGVTAGSFSVPDGKPTIRIDVEAVPEDVSEDACETMFATLTHELVHYGQWTRGTTKVLLGGISANQKLDESQCVLKVMIEAEAYTVGCLRSRRYGWTQGLGQCEAIDIPSLARAETARWGELLPECVGTWEIMAVGSGPFPKPVPKTRKKPLPQKRNGPIYLAPP